MSFKRSRTSSAYEEANIQEFVDATIDFDANITFAGPPAKDSSLSGSILLIGTAAQLAETDNLKNLPFWSEAVEAAINEASEGALYWTTLPQKKRLAIANISGVATRYNCPDRPDLIIASVAEATKAVGDKPLDIFVCCTNELVVASAIPKATTRPFSAKSGRAEKAYRNSAPPVRVFFLSPLKANPDHLKAITTNIQICMRLIDAPTNLLDTTTFPEIAAGFAKKLGFGFEIIVGEDLREQGFGGLYDVGKAAEFPPALVTLKYKPKGGISPQEKIALVGKGIVYDTGGLSIKHPGPTAMSGMKCDMGGAAAVFAGFLCAVMLEVEREVSCVLCLADNAISPRSLRNDDIIRLKSGITVEVNNTDAEGRLVLSDGVWHASQFGPDCIIDMATLTGAQGIATGKHHAAVFTDSDAWEQRMVAHGKASGDLLMPILYAPEFHNPEFSSKVADYRNSVRNRSNAQSSCAGQFIMNNLKHFSGAHVHIDLAGPAFQSEAATGYGVGLLVDVLTKGKI